MKGISWSARAASRWILEKLKEDKQPKVLKVQASNETLEGSGSKELVSVTICSVCRMVSWTQRAICLV